MALLRLTSPAKDKQQKQGFAATEGIAEAGMETTSDEPGSQTLTPA